MHTPLYITHHSDAFISVRFPFDRDAVIRLQTIPGAFWHPASDAWLVPTNQTTALAQTFTGWPLRWPSGTPTATATPEPSWAELLFAAVGSERADAVFKALARVLHPDARPTTEKGRVA